MTERLTVSAAEAAIMLGVSKPTMYRYMHTAGFPVFHIGGRSLISVDGLKAWVERQVESNAI